MRSIFLAVFIAAMIMLVPITSFAQTKDIAKEINIMGEEEELPSFYITEQQNQTLNNFVENNFEGEEKTEAKAILDEVIKNDLEVDIAELANKLSLYVYVPIPENELEEIETHEDLDQLLSEYWGLTEDGFIKNLFSQLLIKIIEMIKDRLGWTYTLFTDGTSLFYNGINLFVNVVKDKFLAISVLFVMIINDILAAPRAFIDAIQELFQFDYDDFVNVISQFLDEFSTDIIFFIDEIKALITNDEILSYLDEIEDFIIWLDDDPWKDPIHVSGSVTSLIGSPRPDTIVSCKGQTTITDSNGGFDFYVDPNPDSESIPKNEYYGMHNCMITISDENGEIKSTVKLLSYCFSGGEISWRFLVKSSKAKNLAVRPIISILIENFITKINMIFTSILNILNYRIITPSPNLL